MAILFETYKNSTATPPVAEKMGITYVIGGQASDPQVGGHRGIAGPFPKYSISKEVMRQDNYVIGEKFSITITGTALITNAASMLDAGKRQSEVHELIHRVLNLQGAVGQLTITPYGGEPNDIIFNDARVISVDAAEQDDESAGTQFQEYTFTLEAYDRYDSEEKAKTTRIQTTRMLESFEESWDVSLNEGVYSKLVPDRLVETDDEGEETVTESDYYNKGVYKVWTIVHSVSAVGFSSTKLGDVPAAVTVPVPEDQNPFIMGYSRAKDFVDDQLVSDPLANATTPKDPQGFVIDLELPNNYKVYDHVRQRVQDIASRSCSVTDTWIVIYLPADLVDPDTGFQFNLNLPSTHEVEYSFEGGEEVEYNTVSVNLTITGLNSKSATVGNSDRYDNALTSLPTLRTSTANASASFYNAVTGTTGLKGQPKAESETHNETAGTITYNATFDDATTKFDGAITESLTVTESNLDAANNIVAIIPVLEKSDGPVIQDMQTTNEKTRAVSFDLVMKRSWRDDIANQDAITLLPKSPNTKDSRDTGEVDEEGNPIFEDFFPVDEIVNLYKPVDGYRQTKSENWNPYNGNYNLSVDWVYI